MERACPALAIYKKELKKNRFIKRRKGVCLTPPFQNITKSLPSSGSLPQNLKTDRFIEIKKKKELA